MICERLVGNDLEGRSHGLLEAFFDNFLYQLREIVLKNSIRVASALDKMPTDYVQNKIGRPTTTLTHVLKLK